MTLERRRTRRLRTPLLLTVVALTIVASLPGGVAWAYWTARSVSGGNGAATATAVNPGTTPSASEVSGAVTVTWTASTLAGGQAVGGYLIKRYDAGTQATQSILSNCTGTITTTSCVESAVPSGSWQYTVTPAFATNWRGVESAKSAPINVSRRPAVTATVAALAFTENGSAALLDAGITVTDSDSDVTGATISMTTNYVSGQDTLNFSAQNGITGNWVAVTGVLTLIGTTTAANYQTALRSITYTNFADNPAANNRNVTFVAGDAIGQGSSSSRQIAVTAVNDGPVNSVPGTQTTAVNTAKVFSAANGNLVSISDVDAAAASMQVQLVSTGGATTVSTVTGLTFSVGDGTADATMTFTGTVAAVNTALSGLSFNPTTNVTGAASLQIVTSDQGATGTGGTLSDSDTIAINVGSLGIFTANQDIGGPSIAGSSSYSAGTYTVSGSGADIWVPPDQFQYLTVPMTGDGRLTARVVSDTNPHAAAKAGVMVRNTLTAGSVHALMNIMASNGSEYIARTVDAQGPYASSTFGPAAPYWVRITRIGNTFTGEYSADGSTWTKQGTPQTIAMGATVYFGLAVSSHTNAALHTAAFDNVALAVPNAPVLTASGGATAHTENVPVVVDSGITVTDVDDPNMQSATVTIGSGYAAGQDVLAFTNQNGITGSWSAPTMTLTGSATNANWQAALRSITYNNTSHAPSTASRTINFVVNDGNSNSNTAARTVSVAAANDAPVNSVPGTQKTSMNTAKVFSTGNANLISIADVDAAGGTMQVELISTNGATTVSTMSGLTFSVGDGTADATMTFTGSLVAVNAALSGLSFHPTTGFVGAASLRIVAGDQGNTGTGGALSDSDTVAITVGSYFDAIFSSVGLLNYFRLGESVISSDAMSGTVGATLQSRSGEANATWTRLASSNAEAALTNAGRARKHGTANTAKYVISTSPASADYSVEADLFVASHLTGDVIGLLGRTDPNDSETYYLMRYEQSTSGWSLFRVVNNNWVWIGAATQTLAPGSTHRLTLDMRGTTIRMLVNGTVIASATDSGITGPGRAGVMFGGGAATTDTDTAGYHIDNFRVSPPLADSKGTNHGDYLGGVLTGQTGAIAGDANTAALFDGINDFGSVSRPIQDDFSIEFWFKSTQGIGTGTQWWSGAGLVDGEVNGSFNDFGVSLRADGRVLAGIGPTDVSIVSTAGGYNNGAWHHVVFTRTRATGALALYIDGAAAGTATGASTLSLTSPPRLTFGRLQPGANYFAGLLDEIAIYNVVLSATDVTAHYIRAS